MNIVIIYDLNEGQSEVKKALVANGYYDYWYANEKRYDLPQTTLWKKEITFEDANNDIKRVIENLNKTRTGSKIVLERYIALSAAPWDGLTKSS